MPEGPEVKTVVDFLKKAFDNTTINHVTINSGRYVKHGPFEGYTLMKGDKLVIDAICCKGKFIYFKFTSGASLWCTLGMSGVWQKKETKHTRVTFENDAGSKVYFNDVRNFGTLKYTRSSEELAHKLSTLGPDVLNDEVSLDVFKKRFMKKPNKTIAECLMNQSVISGIGNYLKAEILYASRISPYRLCKDITDQEFNVLKRHCYSMPRLSYESGGATIKSYYTPDGSKGTFSRRFAVYGQKFDLKGNSVIKETTKDKRTTHWVPSIQV